MASYGISQAASVRDRGGGEGDIFCGASVRDRGGGGGGICAARVLEIEGGEGDIFAAPVLEITTGTEAMVLKTGSICHYRSELVTQSLLTLAA